MAGGISTLRAEEHPCCVGCYETEEQAREAMQAISAESVAAGEPRILTDPEEKQLLLRDARLDEPAMFSFAEVGAVAAACVLAALGGVLAMLIVGFEQSVLTVIAVGLVGGVAGAGLGLLVGKFLFRDFDRESRGLREHFDSIAPVLLVVELNDRGEGTAQDVRRTTEVLSQHGGRVEVIYRRSAPLEDLFSTKPHGGTDDTPSKQQATA